MKRTPLHRKTPLKPSGRLARRAPIKAKPRPAADRVTPALHAHILTRDRYCIGYRLGLDGTIPPHTCRDAFGNVHAPDDAHRLTVDHVWEHAGGTKGDRAPSDAAHLVAACHWLNVNGMTRVVREGERAWLTTLRESGRL